MKFNFRVNGYSHTNLHHLIGWEPHPHASSSCGGAPELPDPIDLRSSVSLTKVRQGNQLVYERPQEDMVELNTMFEGVLRDEEDAYGAPQTK